MSYNDNDKRSKTNDMERIIMIIATIWEELKKDWKRWRSK